MKIFKSINPEDNKKEDNFLLLYEQKIEERKSELSNLDYLLKSKRTEVAIILGEKKLSDEELRKLEVSKNKLETELKKISERLEIMIKLEIEEREAALSTQTLINHMESMKDQSSISTNQKEKLQNRFRTLEEEENYLIEVKKEISISLNKFNHLGEEISAAEERLKKLLDRENIIKSKSYKQFYADLGIDKANNSFQISFNKKIKDTQRCVAITKKGERCCKQSLPKEKLCLIHSKIVK